ncbi:MAG: biotin-dependent carboxyltransferase family protein [Actinomycetota bacterium]|nr:biotin-dependent carboxyltransferase family protein [Actinomycetota bacterium]
MAIEVIEPGLATSIQDEGRPGYYNVGVPPSGALDLYSAAAANALVGNAPTAAVIESAYMGPKLRFTEPAIVAVTGADIPVLINGASAPSWEALDLKAGDELSFGILAGGARIYLAIAGGIDVPVVLGSRSLYALGAFGGFDGRALQAGDVLPVGVGAGRMGRSLPTELRPRFGKEVDVRIVLGLYDYRLTDEGLSSLVDRPWQLSPVADRIGFRYSGNTLKWKDRKQPFGAGSDPSNITDAGYPVGSIQVPGGIEPIILHRDAVSGGGYAQVGTVISADMDLVAQSAPGAMTRFVPVSLDEALAARALAKARRAEMIAALS